jgi:hypothetical protein
VTAAIAMSLFFVMAPAAPAAATTRQIFGISSGFSSLDAATREKAMTMLGQSGCTWQRVGMYWPWIDRNGKSARDWSAQDAYVADSKRHNQTIVGIVNGYAAWANGGGDPWAPATDPTEFANFARDSVNRYKNDIHIWEVWNEENGPSFWKPSPDAAAYARMLRATYLAIKQADPSAQVVIGGIDRNDYGYLNRVYATLKTFPNAAANHYFFDALACHPYGDNRPPESDDPAFIYSGMDRNFAGLPKMKAAMDAQGDTGKHILVTEMGWTVTDVPWTKGVGAANQAAYLTRAYQMAQDWPWLDCMMWYGFRNWNTEEDPFSLVDLDLTPRPSFDAFKAAAAGGVAVTGTGTGTGTGSTPTTTTPPGTTPGSGTTTPTVRPKRRPRGTLRVSRRVVTAGRVVLLRGSVSPAAPGLAVRFQKLTSRGWRNVKTARLGRGSICRYRVRVRRGTNRFRLVSSPTDTLTTSTSRAIRVVGR